MSATRVARPGALDRFADRLPAALPTGLAAAALIAVSSFGAGAVRNRGGILDALGLNVLAYGHAAGVSGAVLWAGIFLLVTAWVLLGRRVVFSGAGQRTRTVRRACLWWCAALLPAAPVLSRDVYSYLMQGAMLRDGFDPYSQGAAANPGPMLLEVSHDWRNTTTPYGPLHLWLGEGVTRLVGDNVTAGVLCYKLIAVAGMAAIVWAVPRIAEHLGGDPALALWLGATNPVMILHMVGGMHNESLMVGLVSVGLVCALRGRFAAAVALIAVAVSLKATAAIALPFVVWMATRRLAGRGRGVGAFLLAGSAVTLGTVAVISAVTWASGASWGWLAEISGNSKVINPLSLPSALAGLVTDTVRIVDDSFTFNTPLAVLRTVFSALMLVGLVVVWWLFRHDDRQAVRGIAVAYAVAFVCNAVSFPWYYASLLTLVAVTPVPRRLVQWTAGASVVLAVAFTGSGNHQLYNVAFMAAAAVAAWVAVTALRVPVKRPSPAPGA